MKRYLNMLCLVPMLLMASCGNLSHTGTNYYIDPDRGSDSSDGTSPEKAFRSLSIVRSLIIKPGDSILLRSGAVFKEQLYFSAKGDSANHVVLGKYGGGARPHLKGEGSLPAELCILNSEYIEIRDLEITNEGREPVDGLNGVLVRLQDYGTAKDITLDNLFVHNVLGGLVKEKSSGGNAILLKNFDENDSMLKSSRFDGLLVQNCHISNCQRNGIMMWGNWIRKKWNPNLRVIIRNNLVEGVPGDGIVPVACKNPVIEYNIMRNCPSTLPVTEACDGIWPWSCDSAVVQFNIVSDHKSQVDGYGFDSDWNSTNSIFQYNLSYNNDGGFLLICNPAGWPKEWSTGNKGTIVRYNISINDGIRDYVVKGRSDYFSPVIHITGDVRNTLIEKNLFIVIKKQKKEIDRTVISFSKWFAYPDSTVFRSNYISAEEESRFADTGKSTNNSFYGNFYKGELLNLPEGFQKLTEGFSISLWNEKDDSDWEKMKSFISDKTINLNGAEIPVTDIIGVADK